MNGSVGPALRTGFAAFERLIAGETPVASWPLASEIAERVPVYDGDRVRSAVKSPADRAQFAAEWARVLEDGPGVVVARGGS